MMQIQIQSGSSNSGDIYARFATNIGDSRNLKSSDEFSRSDSRVSPKAYHLLAIYEHLTQIPSGSLARWDGRRRRNYTDHRFRPAGSSVKSNPTT
jgi:hypothetical protein